MLKHYIVYLFPNDPQKIEEVFDVKFQAREIIKRDLQKINRLPNAYAFYFFDRYEEIINGQRRIGKSINHTLLFYLGPAYTLSDIEAQFPEEANDIRAIFQIEAFGITQAIRTCYNSWIFLDSSAIII